MIVLAAHGTRDPAGPRVITRLAARVQAEVGVPVRVAYADVRQPDLTSVLRSVRGPAVVVPAFLASGYHVRVDIPAQIEASGHRNVVLTEAFGPAPELVGALRERLVAAGYRRGDAVVLAAAGSSDRRALAEVRTVADALGSVLDSPVRIGYAATASPSVAEAVASYGKRRVAVASWLLAPGLFQRRLDEAGADVVAAPLGVHAGVVELVVRRYRQAVRGALAA
ncbi:sirohydrochlorin ferrochelatase [Amycolatopsis bartoniae]|uniref:Sirohydrochlorin chelatase n=1 Tax=Amycolatopsis bartoniae TaxID=941986 RepID=A0A8H9J020_9PSEU|nr:sirohydrochlorin chelatase [Amycolatopsis bartoniae]MBB2938884.1 sirohydrochlorin ferrochelatase [Amycolatopsis bartoniae]TVS99711.1 sirohydrochlorin chelatase [Amycolatopsis bartoniae]GHF77349.1 hypothetical protein GCM10017566_59430 [Amycolatopsis bartoniae]